MGEKRMAISLLCMGCGNKNGDVHAEQGERIACEYCGEEIYVPDECNTCGCSDGFRDECCEHDGGCYCHY